MWRSWWSMIQHILITHLHPTYHKSISMDKRVTAWKKLFWVQVKLEEEKVLLKQYISLHCFVEGKKLFVHIGHLSLEKPFCLNMQVSLKQAVRVLHTLARPNCTNKWLCNNFWKLTKKWQKDFNMHVHSNESDVIKMHLNFVLY